MLRLSGWGCNLEVVDPEPIPFTLRGLNTNRDIPQSPITILSSVSLATYGVCVCVFTHTVVPIIILYHNGPALWARNSEA